MDTTNQKDNLTFPTNSWLRVRLAEIDTQLGQLQSAQLESDKHEVKRLEVERNAVAEVLNSIVYPILSLPVEITSDIFYHHLNQQAPRDELPLVDLDKATIVGPLVLSHVCSTWRSIAIDMPSLWCRLRETSSVADRRKLLEYWLPRTRGNMLYLDIASDPTQTARLFPTVAQYSHCWRTFGCSLQFPVPFPIDTVYGRIPLLQALEICGELATRSSEVTHITAFSDAPELRKVELRRFQPRWISLPWAQLTNLALCVVSFAQATETLRLTPNLEELTVDLFNPFAHPPPPSSYVIFGQTWEFFPYVTLPGLQTLDITSRITEEDDDKVLITFLDRSQCTLESISFFCFYRGPISALESITMRNVSKISIRPVYWSLGRLEQFLLRIASDPTFLPNLQSLEISPSIDMTDIPYAKVAAMLSARWYGRGNAAKLRFFRMICMNGSADPLRHASMNPELRGLMDDGLEISIEY
ncbi:F-box domain-containing protein [Favolaschia claudopus]|uniref:F-box domain-containing protein n=1 Tax=Favolaschia claudopus TaxID=2862362 RepID=A0AAW0EFP9_9AGAR